MRRLPLAVAVASMCAIGVPIVLGATDTADSPAYLIRFSVAEETAGGTDAKAPLRRICEPCIATKERMPAELRVGGTTRLGEESIDFGTLVRVQLESQNDNRVRAHGRIEVSDISTPSTDSAVRHSTTVFFDRIVPMNKTVRLMINDNEGQRQWCDITVQTFDETR